MQRRRYIHHSTLRKKIAAFPKIVVLIFFICSVFKKCRCQRFDSCKSEKSSLRADLERAIIYLRKQRRGSRSHRYGFTFGPTQCCRSAVATIDQQTQSAFEERDSSERLFEGIMINHEQLNPLVRWRSLTLLPRIVSEKQRCFIQRVNFAFFFFGSPS